MNSRPLEGSFKIVQTIENGSLLLSVVPSTWENGGKLMYPPRKIFSRKLFQNCTQPPGTLAEGWTQFECIVKRANIPTYEQARKEQEEMSSNSDTSSNEIMQPRQRLKKTIKSNADLQRTNYNDLLLQSMSAQFEPQPSKQQQLVLSPVQAIQPIFSYQQAQQTVLTGTTTAATAISAPATESSLQVPSNSQHQIIYEQPLSPHSLNLPMYVVGNDGNLYEQPVDDITVDGSKNPTQISEKPPSIEALLLTIIEVQTKHGAALDSIIKTQERILNSISSGSLSILPLINEGADKFEPISTIEQLESFEEKLKNRDFVEAMKKKCYQICGKNSGVHGHNVSYAFIDHLFDRKLFTLLTMSGRSRTTGTEKVCFKKYQRVFDFYFQIVHGIDESYTVVLLQKWFQGLMSNSKRRSNSTPVRASRTKNRLIPAAKRRKEISTEHGKHGSGTEDDQEDINGSAGSDKENDINK
ncbi:hypothetical protein FQR65_LT08240 [Abscondita terminalis]|nr:hypothetical protein FQR65_LT08240 [Abscondita terminalis]